ncbi:MAG: hypothetical protein EBR82_80840 [Caulobacteraceae bacterium]|nr:hypothetical protein [Caulobacteraceae bacterium]
MIADPHHNEYLAAAGAMQDFYGRPLTPPTTTMRDGTLVDTHAVGDYVEFVDELGQPRRGYVIEAQEGDTYLIRCHLTGGGQEVVAANIDRFRPF